MCVEGIHMRKLRRTRVIVQHVRNGGYRTSGNDQRQERERDEQGVWHRTRYVVQGAEGIERWHNKVVRCQHTKKKEPTLFSSTQHWPRDSRVLKHGSILLTLRFYYSIIHAIFACGDQSSLL